MDRRLDETGPASGQPPAQPPGTTPKSARKLRRTITVATALLLLVGVAALAYVAGWLPFRQKDPQEVLQLMFASLPAIESAQYEARFSVASEARDPNNQPIDEALPELKQKAQAIKHDQERLRHLALLRAALERYQQTNGTYPAALEQVTANSFFGADFTLDPATGQLYGYRQESGGASYTLHVPLETRAGRQAVVEAYAEHAPNMSAPLTAEGIVEITPQQPRVSLAFTNTETVWTLAFIDQEFYQFLPAELGLDLTMTGTSEVDSSLEADSQFSIGGSLALGDASFALAVEVRKKAAAYYLKLTRAPSFGFFDLAAVKDQWIKFPLDESQNEDVRKFIDKLEKEGEENNARLVQQYQLVLKHLGDSGVLEVVQELPRVREGEHHLYHYQVQLAPDKVGPFYRALAADLDSQFGEDSLLPLDEDFADYLSSDEFIRLQQYTNQNSTIELWIDDKHYFPRRLAAEGVLVPPSTVAKLKDTQYRTAYSISLSAINQPVTVEEPAQSITVEEAGQLLGIGGPLGAARDKAGAARVKSNLAQLRTLAEIYYDNQNGSYQGYQQCIFAASASTCAGQQTIADSVTSLLKDLEETIGAKQLVAESSASSFCLSHPLPTGGHVCLDSAGNTEESPTIRCTLASLSCKN